MDLPALAARLTQQGLWVFPVDANKRPCTEHGFKDAVDRSEKAYRLFLAHPNARFVAVRMGVVTMLVAIDVDPRGQHWLEKNWHRLGNTQIHRTPRGGVHIIYRMPLPPTPVITSRQVCDGRPLLARGVDIQAEGRSLIWAGPGYEIINPVAPISIPSWMLRQLLRQPKPPKEFDPPQSRDMASFERVLAKIRHAAPGNRNNALFWGACAAGERVKAGVASESHLLQMLVGAAMQAGLDAVEARKSAISGIRTTAK